MLARTISTSNGDVKARNEAHALIRTALAVSGDISPTPGRCTSGSTRTPGATAAIAELCAVLTDTGAVFPGTDLKMHYSVKPHRWPQTNYCPMPRALTLRLHHFVRRLAPCDWIIHRHIYECVDNLSRIAAQACRLARRC